MTIAIFNSKANASSVRVLVDETTERTSINGPKVEKITDISRINEIWLQQDETWVYVYPNETFNSGTSLCPPVYKIKEMMTEPSQQVEIEQIDPPDNCGAREIEDMVMNRMNQSFSSRI